MLKLKKLIEEQQKKEEPPKIVVEKPIEKCDLITRLRERQECEDC